MVSSSRSGWDWSDPGTWPFFVWMWIAILSAQGIYYGWRWWRKREAESWPTTFGAIGSAQVVEGGFWSSSKSQPKYIARVFYSYTVNGEKFSRKYERRIDEDEGNQLIAGLEGRMIAVHVNPRDPGKSHVADAELDRVAAERPFPPPVEAEVFPAWKRALAFPFAALAVVGFAASVWAHVNALFDKVVFPTWSFGIFHVGAMVNVVPAFLVGKARGWRTSNIFPALRGTPLAYFGSGLFAYGLFNFFYCASKVDGKPMGSALSWRMFSGHWMIFYFFGIGLCWLLINRGENSSPLH